MQCILLNALTSTLVLLFATIRDSYSYVNSENDFKIVYYIQVLNFSFFLILDNLRKLYLSFVMTVYYFLIITIYISMHLILYVLLHILLFICFNYLTFPIGALQQFKVFRFYHLIPLSRAVLTQHIGKLLGNNAAGRQLIQDYTQFAYIYTRKQKCH